MPAPLGRTPARAPVAAPDSQPQTAPSTPAAAPGPEASRGWAPTGASRATRLPATPTVQDFVGKSFVFEALQGEAPGSQAFRIKDGRIWSRPGGITNVLATKRRVDDGHPALGVLSLRKVNDMGNRTIFFGASVPGAQLVTGYYLKPDELKVQDLGQGRFKLSFNARTDDDWTKRWANIEAVFKREADGTLKPESVNASITEDSKIPLVPGSTTKVNGVASERSPDALQRHPRWAELERELTR